MVKVILFFIISFMLSLTLNVALAAVLYKNWVDKQLHKKKKAHICKFGDLDVSFYIYSAKPRLWICHFLYLLY